MGEANGQSRTVKVVDRRKFTADGEPKADAVGDENMTDGETSPPADPVAAEPDIGVTEPSEVAEPDGVPEPASHGSTQSGDVSSAFSELVAVLAQQAAMAMVGSDESPAKPEEARRMIDYLGALESKTSGNLSTEEAKALTDLLFQLRTLFVQSKG